MEFFFSVITKLLNNIYFVCEPKKSHDSQNDQTLNSTSMGEGSDSLYQMLQEYMVENQHLKEENETLRNEKTEIFEKLKQEEKNNEKITKEVRRKMIRIVYRIVCIDLNMVQITRADDLTPIQR